MLRLLLRLALRRLRRRLRRAGFVADSLSREDAARLVLGRGASARLATVRYSVVVDVDLEDAQ